MKKGIVLISSLGVIIIALLCVLLFVPAKNAGAPAPVIGETYLNNAFDFSLVYPKEATVYEGDPHGLYLEPETSNATTAVAIVFPRVDTFSENGSHGYYEFRVHVAIAPMNTCETKDSANTGEHFVQFENLNGITFAVFAGGGAAAGNRVLYTRYGICRGPILFSVYDILASGSDGTPLTPKLEADIAAGKIRNEQIVRSFQF